MKALVDNDVLFKGASYDLLDIFMTCVPPPNDEVGVLGATRYVLRDLVQRKPNQPHKDETLKRLEAFLKESITVEPTLEEQELAAEFEALAVLLGVSFDTGESQLCAILILRLIPLLITGDKRAILAISSILKCHSRMNEICGRVKCFEQLIKNTLELYTILSIREAICALPNVDKALDACFACSSDSTSDQSVLDGLDSYISHLRSHSAEVLEG